VLFDYDEVAFRKDHRFDIQPLVSGPHDEVQLVGTDALVLLQRESHRLDAAGIPAFANKLGLFQRANLLAHIGNTLVDGAKQGLVSSYRVGHREDSTSGPVCGRETGYVSSVRASTDDSALWLYEFAQSVRAGEDGVPLEIADFVEQVLARYAEGLTLRLIEDALGRAPRHS
jgi:hypothetical protein